MPRPVFPLSTPIVREHPRQAEIARVPTIEIAPAAKIMDIPGPSSQRYRKPSFRLTAPIPFESETHEAVAHALEVLVMPPAEWTCFPAGHIPLPPQFAAKLMRAGLKRNWPDFLVLYRVMHGIEMKRPGETLSRARMIRSRRKGTLRYVEGQREVFPRLEAAGMKIATCRTVTDVLEQLIAWGIPMRWKP